MPFVTSTVELYGIVPPVNGAPFTSTVPVGVPVGGALRRRRLVVVVVRRRLRRRRGLPGIAAAAGKTKLPVHEPYERVVTPLWVKLA